MTTKTVLSYHDRYADYDLGEGHPFRGTRFRNAMSFFREQGLFDADNIEIVTPNPATVQDLLRVHEKSYVNKIFSLAEHHQPYDIETPLSPTIVEAALLIAGGGIACGKAVLSQKAERAISLGGGYHHAGRNHGGGFCIFNDVAVLVEYLRATYGLKRFLILDHDVHFGNGTSEIYYRDPTVLYVSFHQDPYTLYPGTGFTWQTGEAEGTGFNVNVPLPPGTSDQTYLYALNAVFIPLAKEFKPQIIITNGGSDPHFADTLGNLALTVNGFFEISSLARKTAEECCSGRIILIPGSGYNPEVLPMCWYALAAGIVGLKETGVKEKLHPSTEPLSCRKTVEKTLDELKRLLRQYWSCFGGCSINTTP
jgi:acetoin utilization protein AcuC